MRLSTRRLSTTALGAGLVVALAGSALAAAPAAAAAPPTAADAMAAAAEVKWMLNNLWIMIAGCLVFLMHLGFATLESGLTRAKNTVNILFKNLMIVCIGLLTYGLIGFNLMYPGEFNGILSFAAVSGFISVDPTDAAAVAANLTSAYNEGYTWYTDFFFQAMFAATAATIVSGAVAGRIKLGAFLLFAALFLSFCYPIVGAWKWGGGWLDGLGFYDFAGSTLVHSVGGWGALVMAALLGPRIGKYASDGTSQPIVGHNLPLAAIGALLLWFGWFGFNGGSVLTADAASVSLVLVTTAMAAAAGGLAAGCVSWIHGGNPDVTMALNGVLAGLVGITAGADQMAVWEAVSIGMIGGVLVYGAVLFVDMKLHIDDPVGAISVHLVCGIWGTLAVGVFGQKAGVEQLVNQLIGVAAIGAFTLIFCATVGLVLKHTIGLRVSEREELQGLDIGEHSMEAYGGFQIFSNV